MAKYRCVKRLTTDNHATIHEIGDVVELEGEHEAAAIRAEAVEIVKEAKKKAAEGDA